MVANCTKNITVIVPTLAQCEALYRLLRQIKHFGLDFIVVQADVAATVSGDDVIAIGGVWLQAPASRGGQIAAGIAHCTTDWLWVLHDDSEIYDDTVKQLLQVVDAGMPRWGRFNAHFKEDAWPLRIVASMMNMRSKLSKICTGDQGMFFHRQHVDVVGGFPAQPLMEDIEISVRLKKRVGEQFLALSVPITTSGRRWLEQGYGVTILRMWWLRWRYFWGASPETLFRQYYLPRR